MKFDYLIQDLLNEAGIDTRGGYDSAKQISQNMNPQEDISNFNRTWEPSYLLSVIYASQSHPNLGIKIGKDIVRGKDAVLKKLKETYNFLNPKAKNFVAKIPNIELKNMFVQVIKPASILLSKKEKGESLTTDEENILKDLGKMTNTLASYKDWSKLRLELYGTGGEVHQVESDRRQITDSTPVFIKYKAINGQMVSGRFHILPIGTPSGDYMTHPEEYNVTGYPFSNPYKFEESHVKPIKVKTYTYAQFKSEMNEKTLEDLMEIIGGEITDKKIGKAKSAIQIERERQEAERLALQPKITKKPKRPKR
jgi:hypothetical protein